MPFMENASWRTGNHGAVWPGFSHRGHSGGTPQACKDGAVAQLAGQSSMSIAVSISPALLMMPRRAQLCVIDDHRLTGRRSCLGLIDTKSASLPLWRETPLGAAWWVSRTLVQAGPASAVKTRVTLSRTGLRFARACFSPLMSRISPSADGDDVEKSVPAQPQRFWLRRCVDLSAWDDSVCRWPSGAWLGAAS